MTIGSDPNFDYFTLTSGASIQPVAVENMLPALRVVYQSETIRNAGDFIALGSATLHRHTVFVVDGSDPGFNPLRTLWYGTFLLRDVGSTGYQDSAPFTIRLPIVDCDPGDVNGDGVVDFADIDPFVELLGGG